jgi:hypothetical protein
MNRNNHAPSNPSILQAPSQVLPRKAAIRKVSYQPKIPSGSSPIALTGDLDRFYQDEDEFSTMSLEPSRGSAQGGRSSTRALRGPRRQAISVDRLRRPTIEAFRMLRRFFVK